ncbi:hypothetical protein P0M04_26655 [Telluria mixta]|uniref:hypothetical protein n=1 Tax=Telluria mixta TaxID=34071 RepID=UPI0024797562|nr:hypothetical protein [Telluria mixta]WEM95036.1 hypothetical protein P0M04_26655 [Telluria mixta]
MRPLMILRTSLLLALVGTAGAVLADDAAILACRNLTDGAARLACYDAIPAGARPAAASVPSVQSFGLEQKQPEEPARSIESTIAGKFSGWGRPRCSPSPTARFGKWSTAVPPTSRP